MMAYRKNLLGFWNGDEICISITEVEAAVYFEYRQKVLVYLGIDRQIRGPYNIINGLLIINQHDKESLFIAKLLALNETCLEIQDMNESTDSYQKVYTFMKSNQDSYGVITRLSIVITTPFLDLFELFNHLHKKYVGMVITMFFVVIWSIPPLYFVLTGETHKIYDEGVYDSDTSDFITYYEGLKISVLIFLIAVLLYVITEYRRIRNKRS